MQGEFWEGFLEEVIFEMGFKEWMGSAQGKCTQHIKAYILTLQDFPTLATTTLLSHLQSTGQMPNI